MNVRGAQARRLQTVGAAIVLAILAIVCLPVGGAIGPDTSVLIALVVVVSGVLLVWTSAKPTPRPVLASLCVFYFIWFGLAVLSQQFSDHLPLIDDFLLTRPPRSAFSSAEYIVAVSFLSFLIFYFVPPSSAGQSASYQFRSDRWVRTFLLGSLVLTAIGLYLVGGVGQILQSRQNLGEVFASLQEGEASSLSLARYFVRYPSVISAVIFLQHRITPTRDDQDQEISFNVLGWIVVLTALLVNNPVSTPRFWALTTYASIALLVVVSSPGSLRRLYRGLAIVLAVTAVLVLPYADAFRRSLDAEVDLRAPSTLLTQKGDYSSWSHVVLAASYVREHGLSFGSQLAGTVLFWVPRSIWHGKPANTASIVTADAGIPNFLNPATPLPAELYVYGGYLFVILAFAAVGRLARIVDAGVGRDGSVGSRTLAGMLCPWLAVYAIYVMRGSLVNSLPPAVLMIVGVRAVVRRVEPESSRPSSRRD